MFVIGSLSSNRKPPSSIASLTMHWAGTLLCDQYNHARVRIVRQDGHCRAATHKFAFDNDEFFADDPGAHFLWNQSRLGLSQRSATARSTSRRLA